MLNTSSPSPDIYSSQRPFSIVTPAPRSPNEYRTTQNQGRPRLPGDEGEARFLWELSTIAKNHYLQFPPRQGPESLRRHVRRIRRHLSLPLLCFLRHPGSKYEPDRGNGDKVNGSNPKHIPIALCVLGLRLLSRCECLGFLQDQWRPV